MFNFQSKVCSLSVISTGLDRELKGEMFSLGAEMPA